jgi:hypothetical protein
VVLEHRRLDETRRRAEEQARLQAIQDAEYREQQAKETARVWAEQQAAKKVGGR